MGIACKIDIREIIAVHPTRSETMSASIRPDRLAERTAPPIEPTTEPSGQSARARPVQRRRRTEQPGGGRQARSCAGPTQQAGSRYADWLRASSAP